MPLTQHVNPSTISVTETKEKVSSMDKEFEEFMGLDKEKHEKPKYKFSVKRTDEEKGRALRMTWRRTFHFMGYSTRKEFWWSQLFITLILTIGTAAFFLGFMLLQTFFLVFTPFFFILGGFLGIAQISLLVRRFADGGFHRLLVLIPLAASGLLGIVEMPLWAIIAINIFTFAFLLFFTLKPTSKNVLENVETLDHATVDEKIFAE